MTCPTSHLHESNATGNVKTCIGRNHKNKLPQDIFLLYRKLPDVSCRHSLVSYSSSTIW